MTGSLVLAGKDLRLMLMRGRGLAQAMLLGLLLIFMFSLAGTQSPGLPPEWAATIFWLATSFSLVLIFNRLFSLEEGGSQEALLLAPMPLQSIWLGKALAGGALLLVLQCVFFPAAMVFLGIEGLVHWLAGLALVVGVDAGLVILGALFGALIQAGGIGESLLSILVFPLQIPLLLAGIRLGAFCLGGAVEGSPETWYGLIVAFDAVFAGAALVLFPFAYKGEW
jgi:heme exporter protein B